MRNTRLKKGAIVRKNNEKESKDSSFRPCKILALLTAVKQHIEHQTIVNIIFTIYLYTIDLYIILSLRYEST